MLLNLLSKIPSSERVEKLFKTLRFMLWNLFELVLFVFLMIEIVYQHVPRVWGAPISSGDSIEEPATPIQPVEPQQPDKKRRKPKNSQPPVIRVANKPSRVRWQPINLVAAKTVIDIDAPPPIDLVSIDYTSVIFPFDPGPPKPRHNAVIRVVTAPFRSIRTGARKIGEIFRADRGNARSTNNELYMKAGEPSLASNPSVSEASAGSAPMP